MTIFILDTNVISDIAMPTRNPAVLTRLTAHQPDILCLCEAVDLLIAAVAQRIDAVIVSADADFDHLSVRRENWRNA
jgi:predicted nucleic acid-binding protein